MGNVRTKGEVDVQFVLTGTSSLVAFLVGSVELAVVEKCHLQGPFWEDIQALRYEFSSFYSEAFVIIS